MQVPVSEYRYGTVLKQWLFLLNHLSNLTFRAPPPPPPPPLPTLQVLSSLRRRTLRGAP